MFDERIDVHCHFIPPEYRTALEQNGHSKPDGMPAIPPWSSEAHLELMADLNISKSILSISSPGATLVPGNVELAVRVSRYCNAYAASLQRAHPDKFGFWATLPLPDIPSTLAEISTAFDEGAAGVVLLTNYHGHYLGSSLFNPIFEELNRRAATIFIHPAAPCMSCVSRSPSLDPPEVVQATPLESQHPIPMYEFFFDTARAITNLFLSGTVSRFPRIKYVIPHAGGAVPPLLSRFAGFSHVVPGGTVIWEEDVVGMLNERFWFDLAGFVFPGARRRKDAAQQNGWSDARVGRGQLAGLVEGCGVSPSRLVYGSDFPFTPAPAVRAFAESMASGLEGMFSEEQREGIYLENAKGLLEGDFWAGAVPIRTLMSSNQETDIRQALAMHL